MSALLRLFPRRFRERYEAELVEMLDASQTPWRDAADLLRAAVSLHLHNALGALRRWTRAQRNLLVTLLLAGGTGAAAGGSTGFGPELAIAGCSVLGGALASGVCVLAVAGRHRVSRLVLPRVGG